MRIAIIGGGAAGMMAAARIAELSSEYDVFLIERNSGLGKKVIISGGGRCNVTTGRTDLKETLKNYPRGARFLRTALYDFPPQAMRDFMEAKGVPLKMEDDLRVFPKSDDGKDVVKAFERLLSDSGVNVLLNTGVESVERKEKRFVIHFEKRGELEVDRLILSPGGQAYRHTGSKGDGYSFAETLGHSITALGPSLNSFILREDWLKPLSGLSFKSVALTFKGKEKYSFEGPIMFTHKGVTGPAVFALSAYASFETFSKNEPAQLFIDFFPGESHEQLKGRFEKELKANHKKAFHNVLSFFVPKSFADALCTLLEIDPRKQNAELSKKDINKTLNFLKNGEFALVGRAAGDEFVTAGGVELSEVDSNRMESKICPGLFFAGEILNYDGFTGGYNLQAAWATGRKAGESSLDQSQLR